MRHSNRSSAAREAVLDPVVSMIAMFSSALGQFAVVEVTSDADEAVPIGPFGLVR